MVTEPPEVGFGACETGAMNTRLLAGSDADDGTTVRVGDTVGLGVLEGECGDNQIGESLSGKLEKIESEHIALLEVVMV